MGVTARHRNRMEDQQWSITLGNTLLASIVCLLWYVFGLWEDKDKVGEESSRLTSAVKRRRSRGLTRRRWRALTGQHLATCPQGQTRRRRSRGSTCCLNREDN